MVVVIVNARVYCIAECRYPPRSIMYRPILFEDISIPRDAKRNADAM